MQKLNENEIKAMNAILETCDYIDGEYFNRLGDAILALCEVFGNGTDAGAYLMALVNKGALEMDEDAYGIGLWVKVD